MPINSLSPALGECPQQKYNCLNLNQNTIPLSHVQIRKNSIIEH